ncbi:MAG: flagellar motor switch protein FliG [Sulfuricurvum sp. GWF2_44_89]|jgi:flagellar motor switch protein FliG|uniref:Flagellar motor switch protein FliG n=1 Tax=Sulfuricurvum kujiense TaxID=148813 RepID=A0A2D3WKU3_9BACT|nr:MULTISPECIES: flagellar motor switch protein FliG [Sulfuricurvum]OHD79528.1 MAG: flagellar motor switch protein FliG [Sulfuricurvum sp. GWF2_44_89]OHD93281.1 MAG: flagellar motor switch protein FliG [Sulfuricurvum sp. RIFOXYD12_FULL_44_77]OHD98933.1 MAG: flagellar motor switch protein FliG [Sulfuricurvum sp. RIFOXYD2_FULL_44_160]DAB39367.1 MAG TPA: flagellar motor switch protein FliG [Sulfuricurvum kujiense]
MTLTQSQQANFDEMSMSQKIAILLVQLGEDVTATIFSRMNVEAITEVSKYIANNRSIEKNIGAAVLEEFYAIIQSNQYLNTGGMDYAREILYKALGPEEAKKVLERLSKTMQGAQNFSYLSKIKPQQLADFIMNEHPQTVALILAHMDPSAAAETLYIFPDDLRAEVAMRMAKLGDISPSIIKRVSAVLESKLESLASYKVEVGGPRAVADVFNRLGAKASKATLTQIEQLDQELAASIKEMMFTFEDMVDLDGNSIREILKAVDKNDLMLALKNAAEELKEKFYANMSQRAKDAFVEELQFLGAVKMKEVESAQRKIVDAVQALAEQGILQLGESEEMVE